MRLALATLCALALSPLLSTAAAAQAPPEQPAPAKPAPPAWPQVAGTWAQYLETASITDVPIIGDVMSWTRTWIIWEIEQQGADLTITETICHIDIRSESKRVKTILPRGFIQATSGTLRECKLSRDADGTVRFTQPRIYAIRGVRLKDARREKLPEDDDDKRIIDADHDGHPGLTVQVRGIIDGQLYVVQRSWSELYGTVYGTDRIDGRVKWSSEQSVVGASSVFLSSNPDSRPAPRASRHFFKTRRVKPGTSCAEVLKQHKTLFK